MIYRPRLPTVFELIATVAVTLVVLRMLVPRLVFDNQSLVLIGLAALALALPKLLSLLPPLKKVKYGEFEAEFNEAIDRLEERVGEAEQSPTPQTQQKTVAGYPPLRGTYVKGFQEILSSRTSNTEKILAAAILVETMLTETARELGLIKDNRFKSPAQIVQLLETNGFISDPERKAFDEFWQIRNSVVHGRLGAPPNDEQTARVLDLVWRLVRILG
jgi:hypothetical protein